jgi:selT/selW/selH-like putative selenoprotein
MASKQQETGKGHVFKALLCSSDGYVSLFDKHELALKEEYPELKCECAKYPVPGFRGLVVTGLTVYFVAGFFAALVAALGPEYSLPNFIGISPQIFYLSIIAAYYLTTYLSVTDAYELFFDDVQIYSKLETTKFPPPGMVLELVEEQLTNNNNKKQAKTVTTKDSSSSSQNNNKGKKSATTKKKE